MRGFSQRSCRSRFLSKSVRIFAPTSGKRERESHSFSSRRRRREPSEVSLARIIVKSPRARERLRHAVELLLLIVDKCLACGSAFVYDLCTFHSNYPRHLLIRLFP